MKIKSILSRYIIRIKEKWHIFHLRRRNKNTNPTIVCNNCIAGIIYHNLGLKFNSPTINLFIKGQDYLEFVKNFEYYSKCDLVEVFEENINYPIGKIVANDNEHQDIFVYFQHYTSFSKAKEKWVERYARVNWDNVFYIWEFYDTMYDNKYMVEFDSLQNINQILLTHKDFDYLNNCFTLSCYNDDKPVAKVLEYKGLTGKRFLDEFDYVGFINKYK